MPEEQNYSHYKNESLLMSIYAAKPIKQINKLIDALSSLQ